MLNGASTPVEFRRKLYERDVQNKDNKSSTLDARFINKYKTKQDVDRLLESTKKATEKSVKQAIELVDKLTGNSKQSKNKRRV